MAGKKPPAKPAATPAKPKFGTPAWQARYGKGAGKPMGKPKPKPGK
jgi:hypothetical protein